MARVGMVGVCNAMVHRALTFCRKAQLTFLGLMSGEWPDVNI